jgi:AraC-like DNA-binding protein
VIVLRGDIRRRFDERPLSRSTLIGVQSRPLTLCATGELEILAVLFKPGAINDMLCVPAANIRDGLFDTQQVLSARDHSELLAHLDTVTASSAAAIVAVEAFLSARLSRVDASRRRLSQALNHALSSLPGTSVTVLARTLGMSPKTLLRRTTDLYGMSPKLMLRLARVHSVLRRLHGDRGSRGPSLAAIAQDHGFVDQAHLAREFRVLVGQTPTVVRRASRAHDRGNWVVALQQSEGSRGYGASIECNFDCPVLARQSAAGSSEFTLGRSFHPG